MCASHALVNLSLHLQMAVPHVTTVLHCTIALSPINEFLFEVAGPKSTLIVNCSIFLFAKEIQYGFLFGTILQY